LDPGERLSWKKDLGDHPASRDEPEMVSVPPVRGSFISSDILSVEDAVQWGDVWIVLDRRSGMIHFLNSDSGVVRSLGREGPGPGEFLDPVAITLEDSVLWVLNRRGLELDRYLLGDRTTTARFHSRQKLKGGGCLAGLAKAVQDLPGHGPAVLRVCPATLPGPGTAWVEAVGQDGNLSPLLSLPLGTPGSRRLILLRQPVLAADSENVFLGTWDAPCAAVLGRTGTIQGHRCLPAYDRPPTPKEKREGLERRLRWISDLGLLPMEVPSHLPWYDRAFATSHGLVFRRIRTEEERDLVLIPPDGSPIVTGQWFPESTFVGDAGILAAQDLPQGTAIKVYPSPWG
jgi:hypothetical protein